jgi:predicted pyridoxine 5'-phosphate oxidase superfamily flavin-nucleotide-binding protein
VPTIGPLSDHASDQIPASHHDLVQCRPVAALTTVTLDGYPQTSVVWRRRPRRRCRSAWDKGPATNAA